MTYRIYREVKMWQPKMIVGWPGIGNVGFLAVDSIREHFKAEPIGEIEPWHFFYPNQVVVKKGIITELGFPRSRFFYFRQEEKDFILFIGEEQPAGPGMFYATGSKAYYMANSVLDFADHFGCREIYTSGAAVALSHHAFPSRVWIVSTNAKQQKRMLSYQPGELKSQFEGSDLMTNITGLNGLLLGVAKKRGFYGSCVMGEVPDYLSRVPFPYPTASRSVVKTLTSILGIKCEPSKLVEMVGRLQPNIENFYTKLPEDLVDRLEHRRETIAAEAESVITSEDEKWLKDHIDELFSKGGEDEKRPS
jgi:proteasome assembly chaperone (PAC2) family protein